MACVHLKETHHEKNKAIRIVNKTSDALPGAGKSEAKYVAKSLAAMTGLIIAKELDFAKILFY